MDDRELLELAATAVGLTNGIGGAYWTEDGGVFDPLNDDGDALRLAVKLRLHLRYFDDAREPKRVIVDNHPGNVETYTDDPFAATRRAIVRAAAEIGRNK